MKKSDKKSKKRLALFLALGLGVGFALISAQLAIGGRTIVKTVKWDVHFANLTVLPDSVSAQTPTISQDSTRIDYNITLDLPGDKYEFTVDVVNGGTVDVLVDSVEITGLSDEYENVIRRSVSYVDGTPISEYDRLQANTTTTYKVSIEYDAYIEYRDIISEEINLNLSLVAIYEPYNFKINEDPSYFTQLVNSQAMNDRNIDITQNSDVTNNGRGLYVLHDTQEDVHPIYYYRGSVNNNNAIFAGYCWKIVRTTAKGGTKLIYNGEVSSDYENYETLGSSTYKNVNNDATYPFSYNSETNEWISTSHNDGSTSGISFTIETPGDYFISYTTSSESGYDRGIFYRDGVQIGDYSGFIDGKIQISNVTASTVIRVEYTKDGSASNGDDTVKFSIKRGVGDFIPVCTRTGTDTAIKQSQYNPSNSIAYAGYMYGNVYTFGSASTNSNYKFGNSFTYSNGAYTLSDVNSSPNATHHYTCLNSDGTCSQIKYVYYLYSNSTLHYITLSNGDGIEKVIDEMQKNTNDSTIKHEIDNWFSNNVISYFTDQDKDYTNYLEDEVWCNDRSIVDKGAWNSNGGGLGSNMRFGYYTRFSHFLQCPRKNDSFTVNDLISGNGKLTYPVGLLTADEIILAGAGYGDYLYTNSSWWTMTPDYIYTGSSSGASVRNTYKGGSVYSDMASYSKGIRPSIVVAKDVKIATGGDGTSSKPYQFILD